VNTAGLEVCTEDISLHFILFLELYLKLARVFHSQECQRQVKSHLDSAESEDKARYDGACL
jgi:hypothetical protein